MENEIKKYRSELMGIATIMILFGHTVFYGPEYVNYGFLQEFVTLGYSGVDIFLFLSGFGLTFSITKNSKKSFYNHRIIRLLPSVVGIWILYILIHVKNISVFTFIDPILWTFNGGYWYVGFIFLAYLFFPYLYSFSKKFKGWQILLLSLLVSFFLFIPFIYQGNAVSCNAKVCIVTRIPIFMIGMLFAMKKVEWFNSTPVLLLLFAIGVFSLYPYYVEGDLGGNKYFTTYYSILLITPGLIFLYGKLLNVVGGGKIVETNRNVQLGNIFSTSYCDEFFDD